MNVKSPLPANSKAQINAALAALQEADRHIRLLLEIGEPEAEELAARHEHLRRTLTKLRDEYHGQQ